MIKVLIYGLYIIIVAAGLAMVVGSLAIRVFDRRVTREIGELFRYQGEAAPEIVCPEDLDGLPACVQRWLTNAGVVGREKIRTAWLGHEGIMRLKEDGPWMPFQASYYYTFDKPGFVWYTNVKAGPFMRLTGRDMLFKGKGYMLIKLFSLINVANAKDPEIDQGALVRFLAEIVWFPSAALKQYVTWEGLTENTARATIKTDGLSASGVFSFDDDGMPVQFAAQRYMSKAGGYSLETWTVETGDFQETNGIKGPADIEVAWDLPAGKFVWFKAHTEGIIYNTG